MLNVSSTENNDSSKQQQQRPRAPTPLPPYLSTMGTKIEYVDTTHLYASKYIRNSKAIGVLWAIFTICYAIIGIVAFVTPGERKIILVIAHR